MRPASAGGRQGRSSAHPSAAGRGLAQPAARLDNNTEPERLGRAGLVEEQRESGGRRRRLYTITAAGRVALEEWRAAAADESRELPDPGLLKLFFGAEPTALATGQLALHAAKLDEYLELHERVRSHLAAGERLALEAGIAHERQWVAFWGGLAAD